MFNHTKASYLSSRKRTENKTGNGRLLIFLFVTFVCRFTVTDFDNSPAILIHEFLPQRNIGDTDISFGHDHLFLAWGEVKAPEKACHTLKKVHRRAATHQIAIATAMNDDDVEESEWKVEKKEILERAV